MFLRATVRNEFLRGDRHWLIKSRFRAVSVLLALFAILCLGISAQYYASESTRDITAVGANKGGNITSPDFHALGFLLVSVLWNTLNHLVNRIKHRPVGPGVSVAMELLIWIFLMASGLYMVGNTVPFYNQWGSKTDVAHKIWQYAGIVLTCTVCVLHSILFVYACRYCHIRRKSRATVNKVQPENAARIDVKPKPESPSPVIITCVHCQSNFPSRGHEDYELVAGAPTDRPPHYSAAAQELPPAREV